MKYNQISKKKTILFSVFFFFFKSVCFVYSYAMFERTFEAFSTLFSSQIYSKNREKKKPNFVFVFFSFKETITKNSAKKIHSSEK